MNNMYILGAEISTSEILSFNELGKHLRGDRIGSLENSAQVEIENKNIVECYLGSRYAKKIGRSVQLAIYSTELMLRSIGFDNEKNKKTGIFLGNNYASWDYVENQMYSMYKGEKNSINPYVATAWFPAAAQGEISIRNKLEGISKTFSLDQLSSAIALDFAMDMMVTEKTPYAIVGGFESLTTPIIEKALSIESKISKEYPASEGASVILVSNEPSQEKNAKVKISRFAIRSTLEEALKEGGTEMPDYCILSAINHYNGADLKDLQNELGVLSDNYQGMIIGMPAFFLGNICAASFVANLVIGYWTLINQYIPKGYIQNIASSYGKLSLKENTDSKINSVLVIGRDDELSRYAVALLVLTNE